MVTPVFAGTMPPKTSKKIMITPDQGSIQAFFHKPTPTTLPSTLLLETQAPIQYVTDPTISAFMKSLTPSEHIAHKIAVDKLGTSYDIRRTHGFVRWSSRT